MPSVAEYDGTASILGHSGHSFKAQPHADDFQAIAASDRFSVEEGHQSLPFVLLLYSGLLENGACHRVIFTTWWHPKHPPQLHLLLAIHTNSKTQTLEQVYA